ncbi:glutaminyl-peptide cyclotransferase-like isoform X1 [Schistocerca gregaria]|uniref:glutaminyl-peptide cyclotransferase-like isoform X1 n=1 Tax=Schistocerca gregaria TaxID=7010 RepID=UPI00211DA79A|nr:glutaminyl-peptide cyclotransferase-like isoform X1 [Schistocerca gregaria]
MYLCYGVALILLCGSVTTSDPSKRIARQGYQPSSLSNDEIVTISKLSNTTNFEEVLDSILIPRVVGTPTHEVVKSFLVQTMTKLGWDVETDKFKANTPVFGSLTFENVIARLNPSAHSFLTLACHYDSKYFREGEFLGATDSAVPCAMMINLAYTMQKQLSKLKDKEDMSLMFIFFDGEEAFRHWSPTDSIYGARHLAQKWEQTRSPRKSGAKELDRIDVLVLLDLLGAPDPVFYSYFSNTEQYYRHIASTEERLAALKQLQRYSNGKPEQRYFQLMSTASGIEDDHIPFLIRGVRVLHIIPRAFPEVWHTFRDNRKAIDFSTVDNLNKMLRLFVAESLHMTDL